MIDPEALAHFSELLAHTFAEGALLERALTHRSWCAEHPEFEPNERLEFLGDAVLGLVVADHCYRTYPDETEGWLSRARASVVRSTALAEMATELGLGELVLLGKGEASSGGRAKPSILADTLEAVIGALYLDGGWPVAERFVLELLGERVAALPTGEGDQDDKSRLQELAAQVLSDVPRYELTSTGPEHDKVFAAAVWVGDRKLGCGQGRSKKQAEQVAAHHGWRTLALEQGAPDREDETSGETHG